MHGQIDHASALEGGRGQAVPGHGHPSDFGAQQQQLAACPTVQVAVEAIAWA